MSAARVYLRLEQGATWIQVLEYQDSNGDPIDLTDWTGRMQIRYDIADHDTHDPIDTLTSDDGLVLGSNGEIRMIRSAAETAEYPHGKYVWDLEIENATQLVQRIAEGTLTVDGEVTR